MNNTHWTLEGDIARLSCGPLVACVEADGVGVRASVSTWQGAPADAFGLFVTAGPGPRPARIQVQERYIRGHDYVVTYAKADDYPVAPQFYWRAAYHAPLRAVQLQLILSVQTDLLDSRPEVSLTSFALESRLFHASSLDAGAFTEVPSSDAATQLEAAASREHLFVFRNQRLGLSYAQFVHPTDFVAAEIRAEPSRPRLVVATLFPESLEKGVIRRGRISGWLLPPENDLAAAAQLARQFVDEPLPLTA